MRSTAEPGVRPPLLPTHLRRLTITLILAACAVLTGLGFHVAHATTAGPTDRVIDAWLVARARGHLAVVRHIADFGGSGPTVALGALLFAGALLMRNRPGGLPAAIAPPSTAAVTEYILKPVIGRVHYSGDSFPSGHAASISRSPSSSSSSTSTQNCHAICAGFEQSWSASHS